VLSLFFLSRKGVVTGPGTIYETNGNVRHLNSNESLSLKAESGKIMELISNFLDYLGLNKFVQKYVDFVNNLSLPKLF
jgi:hypothetical protein